MKSKGGDFILKGKVKHQKLIAPKSLAFSTNFDEIVFQRFHETEIDRY